MRNLKARTVHEKIWTTSSSTQMMIPDDTRCAGSWFSKHSYSSQKNRLKTSISWAENIIICFQLTLKCAVFFTWIKWFTEQCHCYSVPWRATPCVSTPEYRVLPLQAAAEQTACELSHLWAVTEMEVTVVIERNLQKSTSLSHGQWHLQMICCFQSAEIFPIVGIL